VLPEEDPRDGQPFQSNHLDVLIANHTGIYGVQGYREVTKYKRFWATGSGDCYALGAMQALYEDNSLSAQEVAERGVEAGCTFDKSSGFPIDSFSVRLKSGKRSREQ
jgi:ATP-dependent HslUV protease, peptidase subunit HslV